MTRMESGLQAPIAPTRCPTAYRKVALVRQKEAPVRLELVPVAVVAEEEQLEVEPK